MTVGQLSAGAFVGQEIREFAGRNVNQYQIWQELCYHAHNRDYWFLPGRSRGLNGHTALARTKHTEEL
jgi:hypothetical protein